MGGGRFDREHEEATAEPARATPARSRAAPLPLGQDLADAIAAATTAVAVPPRGLTDAERDALPALPAGLEARLLELLARRPGATNYEAQAARRAELLAVVAGIASPWREALARRLTSPRRDDELVQRFHGALAGTTIASVRRALAGEPIALAAATAATDLVGARLTLAPGSTVVLDAELAADTGVTAVVEMTTGTDPLGAATTVSWTLVEVGEGLDDLIVRRAATAWSPGLTRSEPFELRLGSPGTFRLRADLVQDGIVVDRLASDLAVQTTQRSGDPTRVADEDLIAGLVVPEGELRASYARQRDRLADPGLDPAVRHQLVARGAALETAAAQRGIALDRTVEPGADAIWVGTQLVSERREFLRYLIETLYATGGWAAVDELEATLVGDIERGDPGDADDPTVWGPPRQRVLDGFRVQRRLLRGENDELVGRFGAIARDAALASLAASRQRVLGELERYGLVDPRTSDPSDVDVGPPQAATAAAGLMAATATKLAEDQRDLDELRHRHLEASHELAQRYGAISAEATIGSSAAIRAMPDDQLGTLIVTLEAMIAEHGHAHAARVLAATEAYPLLARFLRRSDDAAEVDAAGLERLGDWTRTTEVIDVESRQLLDNIDRTIAALRAGELSVWREPRVVQLGCAAARVAPGTVLARAVDDQVAAESGSSWTHWALLALTFALAIAAALPTGGSSVVAGIAITAELGTLALDVAMLSQSVEEYRIAMAAAHTDFDRARAIAASEPAWLWLAIDLVAGALDLGAAAKTFRGLAKVRAGAARMSREELELALASLHAEARGGRISAEAVVRLDDELRAVTGAADDLGTVGTDAARLAGPNAGLRPVVRDAHLGRLEARLGVPVELDDTLEEGVQVIGRVADHGEVQVTAVRAGRGALLADILAHQRTIGRVTRYNGLVGKVRRLWDHLVAALGGRAVNAFPAGSQAWRSFEELDKLRGLIDQAAFLRATGDLDAQLLDEEIAFLQGELAHHEEIVRGARDFELTPGGFLVERPRVGQRTQEALARGYKLPDQHPEAYYYRLSDTRPDVYELALKPSAPAGVELPTLHAEVVLDGGLARPTGALLPGRPRTPAVLFARAEADAVVVGHVRTMAGFAEHGDMLVAHGLATEAELAETIARLRRGRDVTDQMLRHEVKAAYRGRVLAYLDDPALDQLASYQRMRSMLDPLPVSDRGNLAERWYQSRFAPASERHVATAVTHDLDDGSELVEDRVVDLFDGTTVTEVKSGKSTIDRDQFEAYMEMVRENLKLPFQGGLSKVKKMKYAFLDTDGAVENLPWIAKEVRLRTLKNLTVEAFDRAGRRHVLTTADEMTAFAQRFGR